MHVEIFTQIPVFFDFKNNFLPGYLSFLFYSEIAWNLCERIKTPFMKFLIEAVVSCLIFLLAGPVLRAQKGLPSKHIITTNVTTHYPQHEDMEEMMLSRLKVPAGFKISIAAAGLGKPRMMEMAKDGSLYITRRDQGDVLLLKDTDGDGRFDDMKPVVVKFPGVHGIAIKDNKMYLCSNRELKMYSINADNTLTDTVQIYKDLPDGGQHANRTMAFGPDGKLYLSVGSDCNDCIEPDSSHAVLFQVDLNNNSRRIYARGLRNMIGFDWHPVTKELWGLDNGSDMKGDELPPEELNLIKENGNYGWPLIYGKQIPDETREDPPGATKAAYAKTTEPSVMDFQAHMAPINLKFPGNTNGFPADIKNDAVITWHGSWNRKDPRGYKVQRIRFSNGRPVAAEDLCTGFLSADGKTRFGRPAGIAVSARGIIYISDDANGVIYAITSK